MTDQMRINPIQILLVEDNPGDARLIQVMLAETGGRLFELTHADRLSAGLTCLAEEGFDLVLLDLSLPDSQGLDTFVQVKPHAPDLPVVVLTGNVDEELPSQAMRAGAQDYLVKGEIDGNLLVRSIRYAIERQELMSALERERQKKREGDELYFIERLTGQSPTDRTAKLFGMGPLREILPEVFDEMVMRYGQLLDNALEKRAYKVDHNVSLELRTMGEDLGVLKALPRDVVELHTSALSKKNGETTPHKFKAYAEEGRFMLLEIMGYLTVYYRRYAIGN